MWLDDALIIILHTADRQTIRMPCRQVDISSREEYTGRRDCFSLSRGGSWHRDWLNSLEVTAPPHDIDQQQQGDNGDRFFSILLSMFLPW